jgi:hypothetical protein
MNFFGGSGSVAVNFNLLSYLALYRFTFPSLKLRRSNGTSLLHIYHHFVAIIQPYPIAFLYQAT